MHGPRDGLVNVAVVEDDVRALAAELETDVLEVRVRGGLHDTTTNESATSEGNLLDVQMPADCLTDARAVAVDDVDNTGREADLVHELGCQQCSEGSELGGLEDDRAASRECGADLPRHHLH